MQRKTLRGTVLAKLSRLANLLALLLVIFIILWIFLTPLGGLETRPASQITTLGLATLVLFFVGLALNVACLVLTLRHYKRSPMFGIIGSILSYPVAVVDRSGLFSSVPAPAAIAYVEAIELAVALSIIVLGVRISKEKPENPPAN